MIAAMVSYNTAFLSSPTSLLIFTIIPWYSFILQYRLHLYMTNIATYIACGLALPSALTSIEVARLLRSVTNMSIQLPDDWVIYVPGNLYQPPLQPDLYTTAYLKQHNMRHSAYFLTLTPWLCILVPNMCILAVWVESTLASAFYFGTRSKKASAGNCREFTCFQ